MQPDSPNGIFRARFDKHLGSGCSEPFSQALVLGKLRHIAAQNDINASFAPDVGIEVLDASADFFDLIGRRYGKDLLRSFDIAKRSRLFRHHVMLSRRVMHVIERETSVKPLATTAWSNGAIGQGSVPPEEDELERFVRGDSLQELRAIVRERHCEGLPLACVGVKHCVVSAGN